jgi:D-glycero-D-manno-heptose 1,7-bisphosphate phosphatase
MGVRGLSSVLRPAVFLDRDGTLNRAFIREDVSHPPESVAQLEILPGVMDALVELKHAGFALVVVTNQPDVARGTLQRGIAEQINTAVRERLPVIDDLVCCYHDDADDCPCRKPRAGMLLDAATHLDLDLTQSFMVGDSWRDIEAGRQAGCTTIQVKADSQVQRSSTPDYWADDVSDASRIVLGVRGVGKGAGGEAFRR